MIDINELRQSLGVVQPEKVAELLDRLEASEHECTEQARLNGIGAERELALMAKLEAAEKERDALKAKIEAMEKQEPVAFVKRNLSGQIRLEDAQGNAFDLLENLGVSLFALPGAQAQPAQGVHVEQDESVRKAWARFGNELHRSPDAPYPGMSEAFEQHFSQSFTDRAWRAESGTWAAAWKAAKRHGAQPAQSVPVASLHPVIDWLRNGCDPQEAVKELELLIAAAQEAKQ